MTVADPFISVARPHAGQAEAAANIRAFLSNSLLSPDKGAETVGLAQDRYSLRTAPQWIGPQLEDLQLAYHQVTAELNSTTDNPLIDVAGGRIHHGGNFQAAAVTSAMEKTKMALPNLGRLLFAQATELVDNSRNKGLPPNLSADDPSLSFTCKGFDVNMAAYMSELASLTHPVSSHVVSAEMGNQSVNSLGLIAARGALESVEVLSLMVATQLYMLCQALDLRCMHLEFVKVAKPAMANLVLQHFGPLVQHDYDLARLADAAWVSLLEKWNEISRLDLPDRASTTMQNSVGVICDSLRAVPMNQPLQGSLFDVVGQYQQAAAATLVEAYDQTRSEFFRNPTTLHYIGDISKAVYLFVRQGLGVPMHRGLVDHPSLLNAGSATLNNGTANGHANGHDTAPNTVLNEGGTTQKRILGSQASEIYVSIRNGQLYSHVMEAWGLIQDLQQM